MKPFWSSGLVDGISVPHPPFRRLLPWIVEQVLRQIPSLPPPHENVGDGPPRRGVSPPPLPAPRDARQGSAHRPSVSCHPGERVTSHN